jgi:hypothetical protein
MSFLATTVVASGAPVVAHQGGWDEVLLVGVPILIIIALLAIAKRRVDRLDRLDGVPPDER